MNGHRFFLLFSVIVFAIPTYAVAQNGIVTEPPTPAIIREDLVRSFHAESKRGTSIFYTQAYKAHGRRVEFHGSIFGEIEDVEVDGCELKVKSELVDLYSGSISNNLAGRTQNKYVSSIRFKLTAKLAADLKVVAARPVRQLSVGTNAICSGARPCTLTWIKLRAAAPVIRLTEITNDVADYDGDVKDFDGTVDQFFLPVSSVDAGSELIAKMRAFAGICAN
jgi:hypothetical protein